MSTPMTPDGIRRAIVERVNAGEGQSRAYLDHLDGVLRGLLWALTGEDPGTYLTEDLARIFTLAGIPHRVEGSRRSSARASSTRATPPAAGFTTARS
jgi:hypothetical protein